MGLCLVSHSVLVASLQNVNVVEQEKIDKLMLEMDGTENKCEWALCCSGGGKMKMGQWNSIYQNPHPVYGLVL